MPSRPPQESGDHQLQELNEEAMRTHSRVQQPLCASHLAKSVDMYSTMEITIAECTRWEAIFRNNGMGALASTPCIHNTSGRCKYEETCQHVHGDLKER